MTTTASVQVLARRGSVFPAAFVGGRSCPTAGDVVAAYRPGPRSQVGDRWDLVADFVRTAVLATGYESPASALLAMRALAPYAAWAVGQDLPLEPERVLTPHLVEHYCETVLAGLSQRSRATLRGALRRVGRATTRRAAWEPDPATYVGQHHLAPPYTVSEVAMFWEAAAAQATHRRRRVLTTLLTLGLGAGLRSREVLWLTPEAVVHRDGLCIIALPDRLVPFRDSLRPSMEALLAYTPPGTPLIGHVGSGRDPLEKARRGIELPPGLPRLALSRLRTTWAVDVLAGVRISEFLLMAGTTSGKSLELMLRYVEVRPTGTYLRAGAGLR